MNLTAGLGTMWNESVVAYLMYFRTFPEILKGIQKLVLMADDRVKTPNLCAPLRNGSDIFQNMTIKILQKSSSLTWSIASSLRIIRRKICRSTIGFAVIKQEDNPVLHCSSSNLLPYTCHTSVPLERDRYHEMRLPWRNCLPSGCLSMY